MLPWPYQNFMSSSWYISCQRWNTWWREFFSLPTSTSTQTIVWYVATFPRQDYTMHTKSGYKYKATFFLQYRLPWDSPLTWVIAAFAIDFCYYWVHRSAHGKSLLLFVLFMIVYWLCYLCITCYLFWVRRSVHVKCLVLVLLFLLVLTCALQLSPKSKYQLKLYFAEINVLWAAHQVPILFTMRMDIIKRTS